MQSKAPPSSSITPLCFPSPAAGAVELRNAVSAVFGFDLPGTISFDYPTIVSLAGYIAACIAPDQQQQSVPAPLAPVHAHQLQSQQGASTDIVGWAASMASPGNSDTSECHCCSCCSSDLPRQSSLVFVRLTFNLFNHLIPAAAIAERIFGARDCIAPASLERWDVERINAAAADIQQVRPNLRPT